MKDGKEIDPVVTAFEGRMLSCAGKMQQFSYGLTRDWLLLFTPDTPKSVTP